MHKIMIVDQTAITASFDGKSLFINSLHILDADKDNEHPIESIANLTAKAIGEKVTVIELTEHDLAIAVAKKINKVDELEDYLRTAKDKGATPELDWWCSGYDNDDVLNAVKIKIN